VKFNPAKTTVTDVGPVLAGEAYILEQGLYWKADGRMMLGLLPVSSKAFL